MATRLRAAAFALAVVGTAGSARADRTVLTSGDVIEGKVTRKGDRVVIEVESGTIALPAESVARVEKSDSLVAEFEARYKALRPGDASGRLTLANYCRDHDMKSREQQMLREVIELDPNNGAARTRLGYVKTDGGWVTEADANRAKGLVLHEGRWVTQAELHDILQRQEEASQTAARRAEDDELEAKRRHIANEQAELDAERTRAESRRSNYYSGYSPYYSSYYSPYYSPLYFPPIYPGNVTFGAHQVVDECPPGAPCRHRVFAPLMPPAADSTSMSVVKVPYRHSR